jgi:hypothetical protein
MVNPFEKAPGKPEQGVKRCPSCGGTGKVGNGDKCRPVTEVVKFG